jgi:Ulp1 family protease
MPSQRNGYDCGLYVCAAAEALCKLAAGCQQQQRQQQDAGSSGTKSWEELEQEAFQHISSGYIADLRAQMLVLIQQLAEQEQRVKIQTC